MVTCHRSSNGLRKKSSTHIQRGLHLACALVTQRLEFLNLHLDSLVLDLNFRRSRRGKHKHREGKWGQQAGGQEKILAGTVTEPMTCCVQCTGY